MGGSDTALRLLDSYPPDAQPCCLRIADESDILPSQAEKMPSQTEPNAKQDQRNDLQFESLKQEKRQHHPAQREWIDLLETHNFR